MDHGLFKRNYHCFSYSRLLLFLTHTCNMYKQNIFLLFMYQFSMVPAPYVCPVERLLRSSSYLHNYKAIAWSRCGLHSVQYAGYLNESERLCLEPRGKNTAQLPSHFPLQFRNIWSYFGHSNLLYYLPVDKRSQKFQWSFFQQNFESTK